MGLIGISKEYLENKALEAYPEEVYNLTGEEHREGYIKGYIFQIFFTYSY